MTDLADRDGIQAAVNALAADFECPVLLEDKQHRPLWWSAQEPIDDVRMHTILRRTLAPEALAMVRRLKLAVTIDPVRTPEIPKIGMQERWCVSIWSGREHLGYLWVIDGDHRVGADQLPRLVEIAELIAADLTRTASTTEDAERLRSALLDRLLRAHDEQAAHELAGLDHLSHDALIVVREPRSSGGWALSGGMSAHIWTPHASPATSGAPLPLVDLSEAVRRAAVVRRVVAAGAVLERRTWDGLGAWRLVVETPESVSVATIHPGAEVLASQPRASLMATARVVLDLGGDVAAAADRLFIHRTTLYYRLDRIADLIGVDLRHSAERTDLQLALWLAAYRQVRPDS
jgi:hypothetical protein